MSHRRRAFTLVDKRGLNCLFSDGSVVWHVTPAPWTQGFAQSWQQLDRGVLGKVP